MKTLHTLNQVKIGWASTSLVTDRPVLLSGQLYYRVAAYVHDPVTATALVIENGEDQVVMVSCDMVGISHKLFTLLQDAVDGYNGLDGSKVTCSATHTHNNSSFTKDASSEVFKELFGPDKIQQRDLPSNILIDDEATEFWLTRVTQMIKDAWDSRKPGAVSTAHDYAAVAFNRRPVFKAEDGSEYSKMYGTCSEDSFIRFEGPADHSADMLYTFDLEGNLTGVLVDIPAPSQINELHYFVSADYWHSARLSIREKMDKNIYVLPICGPAGDQNPIDLVKVSKNNAKELAEWNSQVGEVWCNYDLKGECDAVGERIADAVVRGYKVARNTIRTNIVVKHEVLEIKLPIRKVDEAEVKEAQALIDAADKKFSKKNPMTSKDQVALFEPIGVLKRWDLQNKDDIYTFKSNIFRIDDAVFATNTFELFVEFSFRIKARAKAQKVFLMQLTNGTGGYLPTKAAIAGGSYSSKPASTVIDAEGGDNFVEIQLAALNRLMES